MLRTGEKQGVVRQGVIVRERFPPPESMEFNARGPSGEVVKKKVVRALFELHQATLEANEALDALSRRVNAKVRKHGNSERPKADPRRD